MSRFIHSSLPTLGSGATNSPVNIELVTQVHRTTNRPFPENADVPVILFDTCGGRLIWSYPDAEAIRDRDYDDIVHNRV